ncbi:MAG: FAD-binding oxidoreductase [Candidatus Rokubacteria bacterium]|nr:FAD-binding oxidoreductase [Candidatus Rokubacteria bacterium]
MEQARTLIVGGGIAGLSVAYHLGRSNSSSVVLLEREPALAAHASGQNAGIFRPLEPTPGVLALARRSRLTIDALFGERFAWFCPIGGLFVAPDAALLHDLVRLARRAALRHVVLQHQEVVARAPILDGGDANVGLMTPDVGIIDVHGVVGSLAQAARAAGVAIATGCEVTRILARRRRVEGVELSDGHTLAAETVVIAAGAWSGALGASCGAEIPLVSLRRHLVSLAVASEALTPIPVVWRLGDEVYLRPDHGGVLASPCDEEAWPPSAPPVNQAAVELLGAKLARLAPEFIEEAAVRRSWACLRTFAPDRLPVVGPDPRVRGLFWISGLGGAGMTIGVAAGEMVSMLISRRRHPLAPALGLARLLAGERAGVAAH